MSGEAISVAVINYNGERTLASALRSVFAQEGVVLGQVLVVDNASTDRSLEVLAEAFSDRVRIVRMDRNGGPNPARNRALQELCTRRVLLMDNDIILAPDYVRRLQAVFDSETSAAAASGQIRFHSRPDVVQYNGADIHFAGEVVANPVQSERPVRVATVSAGAVMLDRKAAARVGRFDEDLVFGWEDGDLMFTLTLAGFICMALSTALCYHMKDSRTKTWVRHQTRNRWWFILKHYDRRTLALALPAILLYQSCAGLFFALKGQGGQFLLGCADVFRSLRRILRKRRDIQRLRRIPDSQALCGGAIALPGAAAESTAGRAVGQAVSLVLGGYWRLIRPVLR